MKYSLKSLRQISDFYGIWRESLVEVTVQNFRLLFLTETDFFKKNKSFLRCCDILRQ